MSDKKLIVLAGPTASGKTATAIALAKHFDTIVISADSRQFYREMSIGTAAPTKDELAQVPHYLVHHKSITDTYNVADFQKDVFAILEKQFTVHDKIILAGGSGMYIDVVCKGIDEIPDISPATRQRVADLLSRKGLAAFQEEVRKCDSTYFEEADIQNPRRLQRALEVYYQTGKPFSSFRNRQKQQYDFDIIRIAIECQRDVLIDRINGRVDKMMELGLEKEARSLYPYCNLNTLNTVGYKELFDCFDGKCSIDEAVERIKISTRQYAKRQMTWFRKDSSYKWFSVDCISDMIQYIENQ